MRGKRMWHTLRLYMTLNTLKRTEYLRKNCGFAAIGENCSITDRKVPLYAGLISIGNNVKIAAKVSFVTHDITHGLINRLPEDMRNGRKAVEKIGCISIGDNVFIGTGSTVLYDVRIGSNVIIGAGSLVNKDIPDNSIAAGVPARVIGRFEDFVEKRLSEEIPPKGMRPSKQEVSSQLSSWAWEQFNKKRENKGSEL